jgi:hypothetical protein
VAQRELKIDELPDTRGMNWKQTILVAIFMLASAIADLADAVRERP